jgi:DNA-binding transcriptional ArsR family regulator
MPKKPEISADWRQLPAARRDILRILAHDGPLTGQELADRIRRSRSRTQKHLRVLRNQDLVKTDGPRNNRDNTITSEGTSLLQQAVLAPPTNDDT